MCRGKVMQHPFDNQFAAPIRGDGILGVIFLDGNQFGHSVCCTCARKNDFINMATLHCFQQRQRSGDVIAVILCRVFNRVTHISISRKMHNGSRLVFV